MNYVDKSFAWLIQEIDSKTEEELFLHMKGKYLQLPLETKLSLENFLNQFHYWGNLNFQLGDYEQIHTKAHLLHKYIQDYKWFYEKLTDYRSKKLLFAILYNWYDYDFNNLKDLMDQTYCHYFDLDIINCDKEVFVDVGAYVGDSTLDFINSYGIEHYKKIYCYEMTKETFAIMKENLKQYPNIEYIEKAVSDQVETVYLDQNVQSSANGVSKKGSIEVKTTSLDQDIKEKVTMIKMDIEGGEQKALKGCARHIKEDHPKLLISVYHNHKDLIEIPKWIEKTAPGYQFYLRFYGSNLFPTEIVLFAIPK